LLLLIEREKLIFFSQRLNDVLLQEGKFTEDETAKDKGIDLF
jgi:hypothetical protein